MVFHNGKLFVFGDDFVLEVNHATRGADAASIRELSDDSPLMNLQDASCACSDGGSIFAVVPKAIGADVLWKVSLQAGYGVGTASECAYTGSDPRTVGALVALPHKNLVTCLPKTDYLKQYLGQQLTESQVEDIFDAYDHDGNGVLDSQELLSFWTDIVHTMKFPKGTPQSVKDEAIQTAVERSRHEFDDLQENGLVDRTEFIHHMQTIGMVAKQRGTSVAVPVSASQHGFFSGFA